MRFLFIILLTSFAIGEIGDDKILDLSSKYLVLYTALAILDYHDESITVTASSIYDDLAKAALAYAIFKVFKENFKQLDNPKDKSNYYEPDPNYTANEIINKYFKGYKEKMNEEKGLIKGFSGDRCTYLEVISDSLIWGSPDNKTTAFYRDTGRKCECFWNSSP